MKKIICFITAIAIGNEFLSAQDQDPAPSEWQFNTDVNFYFIPDDFFVLPVFRADKNKLHLEARYNYEDRETFSAWVGYNLSGGDNFQYAITPMIGGVVGLSNGIAPGLEMTLGWRSFELYTETEYVFDFASAEYNFLYNWTDITYSPRDWVWFGISGQRTRLYQTDLDIQRGLLLGGGANWWEVTGYLYNLGFDEPFVLLTLTANF
jgi:hypothetical protein